MPSNQDIAIHEKLLVAKILVESSRNSSGVARLDYREAYETLLNKQEADSGLIEWVNVYGGKGNWEDDLLYVISRMLNLPSCPQKWRDNVDLPLEERLKHDDFRDWYEKTDHELDRLLDKYEDEYSLKIVYLKKQGKFRGEVKDGKKAILNRPIY